MVPRECGRRARKCADFIRPGRPGVAGETPRREPRTQSDGPITPSLLQLEPFREDCDLAAPLKRIEAEVCRLGPCTPPPLGIGHAEKRETVEKGAAAVNHT